MADLFETDVQVNYNARNDTLYIYFGERRGGIAYVTAEEDVYFLRDYDTKEAFGIMIENLSGLTGLYADDAE